MKIEINYLNIKLNTEVEKDLLVKDLITDLKQYLNINNPNFLLFDKNNHKLKENDIISISQKIDKIILYLIDSSLHENYDSNNKINLNENLNINQLIMKITDAKEPLKNRINKRNRYNLFEFFDNIDEEGNVPNLYMNFMEIENNNSLSINPMRNNNIEIEVNESLLKELKEMGFPENRSRQALINTRNNMETATEMLLEETAL